MKNILVVIGTRPEAVKMCPLTLEIKRREGFNVRVVATGQHGEMLYSALGFFGVTPDYDLGFSAGGTLADITEKVMRGVFEALAKEKIDIVLVHGDTSSAFAAALAAFYARVPIGHVEAGLRTHNVREPYPEEFNRIAIDAMADYCFAPTCTAKENLLAEGKRSERIFVTGNTVIDAFAYTVREDFSHSVLDFAKGKRLMLITAHRRENQGETMKEMFLGIVRALALMPEWRAVFPVHKNPAVREAAEAVFSGSTQVKLTEPLGVGEFHNILARADLAVTDSGGVQEEAAHLGVPVLVMRSVTERREAVDVCAARLIGNTPESVFSGICDFVADMEMAEGKGKNIYGDGKASQRIANILAGE